VLARAVAATRPGGPEVLEVIERDVREPGPGEVRIQVAAAAVNPTDIGLREHGVDDVPPPWVPGMDAAGVVESVGDGVDRLEPGNEVMAAVKPRRPEGGAQSELIVVPAASVVQVPDAATFTQAATLPMNGLTALLGLELLGLSPGQTLVVTGGAGLLASYAIPLAVERGLRVVADAKPDDAELVQSFGAKVVPRGDGFTSAVLEATDGGADAVFDTALLGEDAFPVLHDGGAMAVVRGWHDGDPPRGIRIEQVWVRTVLERTDWLELLRDRASAGQLALRVAGEYAPEQAAEAQLRTEAGGIRGRAVIMFPD
jgi:NADPH:quinone reductase